MFANTDSFIGASLENLSPTAVFLNFTYNPPTNTVMVTIRAKQRRRLLLLCILVIIAKRNEITGKRRHYLTRVCLPAPTVSAWSHLFSLRNNKGFILTMGVGVQLFEDILAAGFHHKWSHSSIPRKDNSELCNDQQRGWFHPILFGAPCILLVLWVSHYII